MILARRVFVTGGSGYVGRRVIPELLSRGHYVRALVREGWRGRLPADCETVVGNALDPATFGDRVAPAETFLQMVGVAHPSPAKAGQFRSSISRRRRPPPQPPPPPACRTSSTSPWPSRLPS